MTGDESRRSRRVVEQRYLSGAYLEKNSTWDVEDSPWKAEHVYRMAIAADITPASICDIGCGGGVVLSCLRTRFPDADLFGYDIAPDAAVLWSRLKDDRLTLRIGEFHEVNQRRFDLVLLLDVLEHVADPHEFLVDLAPWADHILIHFPLDLSALSVIAESPLLHVRRSVGHIHYFTRRLALELLEECGYSVISWRYSDAYRTAPNPSLRTRAMVLPRSLLALMSRDVSARLMGGQTLFVLARPPLLSAQGTPG